MREIKFRVWDGLVMHTENVAFLGDSGFAIERDGMDWDFEFNKFGRPEFIGMQFTGPTAMCGVEIYEGDILKCKDGYLWVVKWDDKHCAFLAEGEGISTLCMGCVVIGNIHQNPELIV